MAELSSFSSVGGGGEGGTNRRVVRIVGAWLDCEEVAAWRGGGTMAGVVDCW